MGASRYLLIGWMLGACHGDGDKDSDVRDTEGSDTVVETDLPPVDTDDGGPIEDSDPRNDTDPNRNLAPSARAQTVDVLEDTPFDLLLSGHDPDGDALSFLVVDPPTRGTLSGTAPNLRYTPAPDHHGLDRFTFRSSDGALQSPVTEVVVRVAAVNDPPVATPQAVELTLLQRAPIALLAADVDGDALTYEIVAGPALGALEGTPPSVVYVGPAAPGQTSFTWRAYDGAAYSATTTVELTVLDDNEPPNAVASAAVVQEDAPTEVTLWASDPDGDPLNYEITQAPARGTLHGQGAQQVYTPFADQHGSDSFRFRVSDAQSWSSEVEVSLTVVPVNDAPVAAPLGPISGHSGEPMVLPLVATDVDGDALSFVLDAAPSVGALSRPAAGPWTWTPPADAQGSYTLSWHAEDPTGAASNVVEVSLEVLPLWTANADTYHSAGNYVLSLAGEEGVLANDALTGAYGCQITRVGATTQLGGAVTIGCDGGFTYTPPLGVGHTTDTFSYRLTEPSGLTRTATVSIVLHEVVWYVDADAATGTGRSDLPFPTLAEAEAASAAGAILYVQEGLYDGGVRLRRQQQLIGAVEDLVVGGRVVGTGTGRPLLTVTASSFVRMNNLTAVREVDFEAVAGRAILVDGFSEVEISDVFLWSAPPLGGGAGILVTWASEVLIDDFIVSSGGRGIQVAQSTGVQISNGALEDLDAGGLFVDGSSDVTVSNVATYNVTDPIYFYDPSGQISVLDCQLYASTWSGINIAANNLVGDLFLTIARNDLWVAEAPATGTSTLRDGVVVSVDGVPDSVVDIVIESNLVERPTSSGVLLQVSSNTGATASAAPYAWLYDNLIAAPGDFGFDLRAVGPTDVTYDLDLASVDGDPALNAGVGLRFEAEQGATLRSLVSRPWVTDTEHGLMFYARNTGHLIVEVQGGDQRTELETDYKGVYATVEGSGELDLRLSDLDDTSPVGFYLVADSATGSSPQLRVAMDRCEADAFAIGGPSFGNGVDAVIGLASATGVGTVWEGSDGGILAARGNGASGGAGFSFWGSVKAIGEGEVLGR